ncbi:hypothetical protein [Arthrobacter sp. UM1]|uniref:hypothetical protein n=1 Tax=Arthrobacter sp. UM1 TaxID=2766776 RepID=UPI001CF67312|nr:hypothetical protein [Arthrobacter sp. UM1]
MAFIIGLALSGALLILAIPGILAGSSPLAMWLVWILVGIVAACAAGVFLTRRSVR